MSINIETERLILREFKDDDLSALNDICMQPYILKWMPDWECNTEQRKKWLGWVQKRYLLATKETARIMLAVTLKRCGKLIGMAAIGNKEEVDNEIELAYFISEEYSGKGYTTEAAKALVNWSFDSLKLDYIIAIVETDNFPSQRVAEKCGFKRIETRMILNSGETQTKPFLYYRLYNEKVDAEAINFYSDNLK